MKVSNKFYNPPSLHFQVMEISIKSFHFFGTIGFTLGTVLGVIVANQMHLNIFLVLLIALLGAATLLKKMEQLRMMK